MICLYNIYIVYTMIIAYGGLIDSLTIA